MQRQFLHSPIGNFTHHHLVRAAAIEFMCRPEFLQKLSRNTELSDNFPIKLHLVDFAILHIISPVSLEWELKRYGCAPGEMQIAQGAPTFRYWVLNSASLWKT